MSAITTDRRPLICWRIVSSRISSRILSTRYETPFTTNPLLFCEMIYKYFKQYNDESPEFIYTYYDLLNFDPDELTSKLNVEGRYELFVLNCHDDEPITRVDIETAEILV
jgi:hypothetical protein